MANDTNKIKLLVLWDILCKNTDENHAMNSDEIREELAKRGISVMRKVVATDIAALNKYGYEVLSYKKKYYYYYVVSRPLETAEVVMLADVIKASKLTSTQKNIMIEKLSGTLCSHQAENLSKHIISLDKSRKGSSSLIYRDPSEWKIIENHHEAIIDKETFDLAQKLTQVKRVVKNHFDDINIFAGLLYCADCGFPITLRRVAKNRNYDFYVCSKYNRRTKIQCTAHSILKRVLNELVLEDIKRVMNDVKTHESEFIEKYRKCSVKEMRSVRLSAQTKIVKAENRIKTLDDIIANLYEDNVTGKISDERFDLLAKKYEAEQTALKSEIVELKKALDLVNDEESNIREFLKVVNGYTEIKELTPEILNNFIDRIYIGEKYSDGSAHKQEIRIIYKFIGAESTHGYKVKGSRVAEIF